ncbi:hypothetical protein LH67_03850 [Xenorhabdus nematophila]|nr:hypothetical protein LH67_03850 [Xenorhabdus nematophila]
MREGLIISHIITNEKKADIKQNRVNSRFTLFYPIWFTMIIYLLIKNVVIRYQQVTVLFIFLWQIKAQQ